jgi:hypothetical protein
MNVLRQMIFFAGLFAAPPALATEGSLCVLARSLETFMTETTSYGPSEACPTIGFALPAGGEVVRSQVGAYVPATGRIELAPDLDLASPLGQSFLLHELVHAAQYRHGMDHRAACVGQLEAEAYAVQAAFLFRRGLTRDAAMIQIVSAQIGHCGGSETYGG